MKLCGPDEDVVTPCDGYSQGSYPLVSATTPLPEKGVLSICSNEAVAWIAQ
jgi:hypothetical protein